jgi:hypothetical protein
MYVCTYRRTLANTFVHAGTNQLNREGDRYDSDELITNPDYNDTTYENDVALIVTSSTIVTGSRVQVINIGYDRIGGGVSVTLTGWGTTSVRIFSLSTC